MSRTIRKLKWYHSFMRSPRHKWKLLAGVSHKQIVTNRSDKSVAAYLEMPPCKQGVLYKEWRKHSSHNHAWD